MTRYFKLNEQGTWDHFINEEHRATITEENLAAYKKSGGYSEDPVIQ